MAKKKKLKATLYIEKEGQYIPIKTFDLSKPKKLKWSIAKPIAV